MKKAKPLIFCTFLGLLFSLLSFVFIGNVGPKYNIAADLSKPSLCQAARFWPENYRLIIYSNGFPFSASGSTEYDVVCGGDPARYLPSSRIYIFTTWQFYANTTVYTLGILGGITAINKLKKRPEHRQ